MTCSILEGDSIAMMRTLAAGSARTCVTSPPYWGLRDYGIPPTVWGGDPTHAHDFVDEQLETEVGRGNWAQGTNGRGELQPGGVEAKRDPIRSTATRGSCACGAWRGCLGLEPTPELFVAHVVEVFREVRRVLADDGTAWVNLGDSYNGSASTGGLKSLSGGGALRPHGRSQVSDPNLRRNADGLKPKDLVGIPWRVAFALQADDWYLRSDIIWAKPNPMPESVTDRPTKAHEYLFLLSKSPRYYYDADAVREPAAYGYSPGRGDRWRGVGDTVKDPLRGGFTVTPGDGGDRNRRTVWTIPTAPFAEAHFATYPPALVEPCILAGSAPGDVVLDPFCGSGTTGMVALRHGRGFVGCELSPTYAAMARRRILDDAPLLNRIALAGGVAAGLP